jgi:hypothetical protein
MESRLTWFDNNYKPNEKYKPYKSIYMDGDTPPPKEANTANGYAGIKRPDFAPEDKEFYEAAIKAQRKEAAVKAYWKRRQRLQIK